MKQSSAKMPSALIRKKLCPEGGAILVSAWAGQVPLHEPIHRNSPERKYAVLLSQPLLRNEQLLGKKGTPEITRCKVSHL